MTLRRMTAAAARRKNRSRSSNSRRRMFPKRSFFQRKVMSKMRQQLGRLRRRLLSFITTKLRLRSMEVVTVTRTSSLLRRRRMQWCWTRMETYSLGKTSSRIKRCLKDQGSLTPPKYLKTPSVRTPPCHPSSWQSTVQQASSSRCINFSRSRSSNSNSSSSTTPATFINFIHSFR